MDKFLLDILEKLNYSGYGNTESIQAWKVVKDLKDEKYIPELISFAKKEKNKDYRYNAYSILWAIAKNTQNFEATQFLIQQTEKEKNQNLVSNILNILNNLEKPSKTNIEPLLKLIDSKNKKIRTCAIHSLSKCENIEAEKKLIDMLTSKDKYDLIYTNWAIWTLKTESSKKIIPYLEKLLNNPNQSVSSTALAAIKNIWDKSNMPIFLSQLQSWRNKFVALEAILKFWDISEIDQVIERIKKIVSVKRWVHTTWIEWTEIIMAMKFLSKFVSKFKKPKEIFEFLLKKQKNLWKDEIDWLEENRKIFEN